MYGGGYKQPHTHSDKQLDSQLVTEDRHFEFKSQKILKESYLYSVPQPGCWTQVLGGKLVL